MSSIKLDLTKFKHIKSDDHTTTLKHKDGHTLTIARNALSPEFQKQLGALAGIGKQDQTASQSMESRAGYDNGGQVAPADPQKAAEVANYARGNSNSQGPKATTTSGVRPTYNSSYGDDAWPSPSSTSVGQQMKAEGGEILKENTKPQPKMPKPEGATLNYPQLKREYIDKNRKKYASPTEMVSQDDSAPTDDNTQIPPSLQEDKDTDQEVQGNEAMGQQMSQMPDIGNVQGAMTQMPTRQADQAQVPDSKVDMQKMYNSIVSGQGGGPMTPSQDQFNPNQPDYAKFGPNGEPPQAFDAAAWSQAEELAKTQQADAQGQSRDQVAKIQQDNIIRGRGGLPPLAVPNMGNSPAPGQDDKTIQPQAGSMNPNGQAGDMTQAGSDNSQDSSSVFGRGYKEAQQGINAKAKALGELGQKQAPMLDQNVKNRQDAEVEYNTNYKTLEAERQAHMQDIKKGFIDPNKYWTGDENGNGGHSKIMSAIGMIIGGFQPAGGANGALQFIQHQMDQNIEAQKANLDAKNNLLNANLHQFGNMRDATEMTRIMQNDIVSDQLKSAAAKAATPMAKAMALEEAGKLDMDSASRFQQFAMMRSMQNLAKNGASPGTVDHMLGYMRVVVPEMAKEMESRYVPGVGLATIPLTPEVRSQLQAHQTLDNAAKDLAQWTKTHSTALANPLSADYNVGLSKSQAVQQMIRSAQLHTVYREGEQPLLDKMVNGTANFMKNFNTIPKLNELLRSNQMQANVLKQQYGLPTQQQAAPQSSHDAARAWLANPKNKSNPKYQDVLKAHNSTGG